jgi:hypothetical protein
MKWKKIKRVFIPEFQYPWMYSHAANPVPFVLNAHDEIVRVFFTSRDVNNVSNIGFVDIDFKNDFKIVNICTEPVVRNGTLGTFDDSGAAMGCIIESNGKFYLFYLGWNLKVTVPWLNTIGLAISNSIDGKFQKYSEAPILDRSHIDPFSISYPSILFKDGIFKMWYGSNLSWGKDQNEMAHVIKYAESHNLIDWKRTGQIHIDFKNEFEYAISKPWVTFDNNQYKMWYSFRASAGCNNYRIGYAESDDGHNWCRIDEKAGIDVSPSGWDSEMICYPSVFTLNSGKFMLYNGNGFGKSGFGVAKLMV